MKFRLTQCSIGDAIANISVTQMPAGADLDYTEMLVTSTSAGDAGMLFRHSRSEGGI